MSGKQSRKRTTMLMGDTRNKKSFKDATGSKGKAAAAAAGKRNSRPSKRTGPADKELETLRDTMKARKSAKFSSTDDDNYCNSLSTIIGPKNRPKESFVLLTALGLGPQLRGYELVEHALPFSTSQIEQLAEKMIKDGWKLPPFNITEHQLQREATKAIATAWKAWHKKKKETRNINNHYVDATDEGTVEWSRVQSKLSQAHQFFRNVWILNSELSRDNAHKLAWELMVKHIQSGRDYARFFPKYIKDVRHTVGCEVLREIYDDELDDDGVTFTDPVGACELIREVLGHFDLSKKGSDRDCYDRLQNWYDSIPILNATLSKRFEWLDDVELQELPDERVRRLQDETKEARKVEAAKKKAAAKVLAAAAAAAKKKKTSKKKTPAKKRSEEESQKPVEPNVDPVVETASDEEESQKPAETNVDPEVETASDEESELDKDLEGREENETAPPTESEKSAAAALLGLVPDGAAKTIPNITAVGAGTPDGNATIPVLKKTPLAMSFTTRQAKPATVTVTPRGQTTVVPPVHRLMMVSTKSKVHRIIDLTVDDLEGHEKDIDKHLGQMVTRLDNTPFRTLAGPRLKRSKNGTIIAFKDPTKEWVRVRVWEYLQIQAVVNMLSSCYDNCTKYKPAMKTKERIIRATTLGRFCGAFGECVTDKKMLDLHIARWLPPILRYGYIHYMAAFYGLFSYVLYPKAPGDKELCHNYRCFKSAILHKRFKGTAATRLTVLVKGLLVEKAVEPAVAATANEFVEDKSCMRH